MSAVWAAGKNHAKVALSSEPSQDNCGVPPRLLFCSHPHTVPQSQHTHWGRGAFNMLRHANVSRRSRKEGVYILPSSVPANCLSPFPRLPNLVTIFPLGWKMNTQQALLSTTIMCPLRSTETPLGPISFPDPIFVCWKQVQKLSTDIDVQSITEPTWSQGVVLESHLLECSGYRMEQRYLCPRKLALPHSASATGIYIKPYSQESFATKIGPQCPSEWALDERPQG